MAESIENVGEQQEKSIVAQTILLQLGGRRFIRFTGARSFVGGENFLMFMLPVEINKVKITLTPMDVYRLEFWKNLDAGRPETHTPFKVIEDVYEDQLQDLFTEVTGLYTHL